MEELLDPMERLGAHEGKAYARSPVEVLAKANRVSLMTGILCMVGGKKKLRGGFQ